MKNSTKMLALITLIFSTIMIISSENWMSMWMGLEINMLSFIPIIEETKNKSSSQSKMIYFLVQSMSSMMMIFTILMNPMSMINESMISMSSMIILTTSMCMKMGMAPIHMWFINIINKMSWSNCMILMTWQKLAPMFIMSNLYMNNKMIYITSILSASIGAIGGIQQTSMKKILAFSSINHMGWMIICMKYNNEMWTKYLFIYSIIITMLILFLKSNSINHINQMNMNMKTNMEKINLIILFMSLGGLPPFIGFLPKWMVLQSLMLQNSNLIIFVLMMTSMITLFYYMRMASTMIMSQNTINKWNIKNTKNINIYMMMIMINMSMPMTMILKML